MKSDEHPLEHKWTLYFDSKTWNPSTSQGSSEPPKSPALSASSSSATSWEATLKMLGQYDTVEKFMTTFRTLRRPSQLERNSNYHLFKNNIKPMWEDPANTKGGKWTITLRGANQALLDRSWMWLVLALIGEDIDEADDICGAVVSTRTKGDRIALWIRDKSNVDLVNKIGRKFVSVLDLEKESGVSLEFSANMQDEKPFPAK
ncbi:translation initiation factor eIF4e, partial [Meira miltonrushii]